MHRVEVRCRGASGGGALGVEAEVKVCQAGEAEVRRVEVQWASAQKRKCNR
ncbi:MAG: hypothetical protein GY820_04685 [Gammaproteobacteria bacterium]|nr:hypothetical protein [Gammaproteobacteria bacterium]